MRVVIALLFFATLAFAENFKLYLKEGGFHLVREYKLVEDRVRYYSIERSDWEEIPAELVDLKKTEAERKAEGERERQSAALSDAEEKFEREMAREVSSIPENPGVYFLQSGKVNDLKVGEVKVITDRKRSILKAVTPIPVVSGKAILELSGEHSAAVVPEDRPNLYFRLDSVERFTIIRLKPRKDGRHVATLIREPVTKLVSFDMETVDIFRQELRGNLYKIWPTKALSPGEYAVVQYTEGEGTIQVWDFRVPEDAAKTP
jgi:hypothetical protein